jgi:uncharacterized membrane protein YdjX (TVP38/TMEM64 family)
VAVRSSVIATLALVLAATIGILAIDPLRQALGDAISGDTGPLRREVDQLGFGGVAIVYGLVFLHTFVWYPAEIVDTAAGFAFGFWGGLVIVHSGWILQGMLAWAIGRDAARPLVVRLAGERRFAEVERAVAGGGAELMLAMRLIPVIPFSLVSYVAGATGVPLGRFVWTTAVGYLPITAAFVYFGSRLESLSLTDPVLWGAVVVLVALIAATRPLAKRIGEQRESP